MNSKIKSTLFGGNGTASTPGDAALALLRVGTGLMMAFGHGMSKIFQPGHFGPPEQLVQGLTKMGVPAPSLAAWLSALAEFGGGLLIALGFFTRPAAAVLAFNMLVAAFVAHRDAPLVSSTGGASKEPALLYLLPALLILAVGAGKWSFDHLWRRSFDRSAK